jgi:hypothetical protein
MVWNKLHELDLRSSSLWLYLLNSALVIMILLYLSRILRLVVFYSPSMLMFMGSMS